MRASGMEEDFKRVQQRDCLPQSQGSRGEYLPEHQARIENGAASCQPLPLLQTFISLGALIRQLRFVLCCAVHFFQ